MRCLMSTFRVWFAVNTWASIALTLGDCWYPLTAKCDAHIRRILTYDAVSLRERPVTVENFPSDLVTDASLRTS
jgi:hypothetical protein